MNEAYKIKSGLKKAGKEVFLTDGGWVSPPFSAVLQPKWKSNKTDFEFKETEIGKVSADYYTYIGPFDHNILSLSDNAVLHCDTAQYIFKRKEAVKIENSVVYYRGILRKVWDSND